MGRNKNPNKKTTEEIVREALDQERKEFQMETKENFEAPKTSIDAREEFRQFWALARNKYKKTKDIEDILWAHLKASGHDKPEDFEAGLKHFGLK